MYRLYLMLPILLASTVASADEAGDIKACDGGKVGKCEELALRYTDGTDSSPKDPAKAMTFLEKACTLKSGRACNNIGVTWSEGKDGATDVDHIKARAYYEKACGLKHGLGCFNFANIYRLGEGVAIDPKLAFDNFKKSCDFSEAKGCTELAIMYYEGKVAKKDVGMAKQLLDKACKLGSEAACKNVELLKNVK
jgi:TPR repeat protein